MAYEVIPGPRIPDLLYLAHEHRAIHTFYDSNSGKNKPLNVRRCDLNFFEFLQDNHHIHPRVMQYIRMAGFEGVLECGFHKVDHALITSLIEVWRPETHTFHLKIGEATITLEDVQVLWGLNVDGPVVTGQEKMNFNILCDLCQIYLGFTPSPESVKGSSIKVSSLLQILKSPFSEEPTEIEFQQRARVYIMILIGGTVFPDLSANRVPIFYLYNLRDFEECASLSWGSAALAYLYRCLCRATNPEVSEVAGPLVLLQLWAWERIRGFRPEVVYSPYIRSQHVYGVRWSGRHSYVNVTPHCLNAARYTLAVLTDNDFAWTPYDQVLDQLPEICTRGRMTWRCDTYMVCWEIVEPHLPSRVMRQFLLFQPIPQNVLFTPNIHKSIHKLKKGRSTDWEIKHAEYIQHWNDRYHHHVVGVPAQSVIASVEYMNWYWDRTVIHVVHPTLSQGSGFNNVGGTHELFMEGYRIMHREFANYPPGNAVYDVPQRYMNLAGASHRLHIESMHYSAQHEQFPGPPPQPVQRASRQRPRQAPQMQPEVSIHQDEQFNFEAEGSGSYRPEMPMTFQPSGPFTNEHGGPSSHPEDRPLEIDLNVEIFPDDIFNMVDERNQSQYMSPPFGSQSYLPTGFSSPQLPQVPMRDMFGLQSRDLQSPVNFPTNLMYSTPESQQMTMRTPDMEELMDVEPQQQGSWRLVRDRVPRERRPRGPCLTGDRHSGPSEQGDGAN